MSLITAGETAESHFPWDVRQQCHGKRAERAAQRAAYPADSPWEHGGHAAERGRDRDGETERDGGMPAGIIAKENLSDECLELGPKCNKLIYNPIKIK